MPHLLEQRYGLSADELLDAIERRFRARVTLEGAVAEVHLRKIISELAEIGVLERFEEHDQDGYPDFTIWLSGNDSGQLIECKNVRDSTEAYRSGGVDVAYKVETQKTRTSNSDPSSRFYRNNHFAILAVCVGKKTQRWTDFMFIRSRHLKRHPTYPQKLATMQKVPLPSLVVCHPWYSSLAALLEDEPR